MRHKTFFRLLISIGIMVGGLTMKTYAQTPNWNPGYSVGTSTGNYAFNYNQTPDPLVEIQPAAIPNTGLSYQWESSVVPVVSGFSSITTNGGGSSYTIPGPLSQTMYYRRKAMLSSNNSIYVYSNIVKISLVSVNWEDVNYIRQHNVDTVNITDWKVVDQLPIGEKIQMTDYMDGLGRSIEKVSRETATPSSGGGLWGDMVQFAQYDAMGREPVKYLPYNTTTQSGKLKTTQLTEQPAYYSNTFSETSAFNSYAFDNSPLNRITNVKQSGMKWAASAGDQMAYNVNTAADSVRIWTTDYVQGDAPVNGGLYPAGALFKLTSTDVNGMTVIEYTDESGEMVLKKIQIDATPTTGHAGWICTYFVYDDFGLLRCQIQPEGVKYLNGNAWSFAGTNGATVLSEQCFQNNYDDKGRTIWKKSPGAAPLNMMYDIRDRLVLTQDGNQATLATPQWTANLYDVLDRTVMNVLYNTTETRAALQADINNAVTVTTVNVPGYTQAPANPVYDSRNTSIPVYKATQSISFVSDAMGSFQSGVNDQFVAEIDVSPSSPAYSGTTTTIGSFITAANLANTSVCTIIKYQYYDNYSFNGARSFDNTFTNTSAYSTTDPDVLPLVVSQRTLNLPTGSQTRVLGTNTFLAATHYYDEKGNGIQTLRDNIKTGVDINTLQHHFDGRVLSFCNSHTAPGMGYTGFITLTKNIFDKLGRIVAVQKQYGSNPFKMTSTYDYDDMGRVKTRHLDPNYNNPNSGGPDLESLNYSFNLHNQLTGINKDYALKTPAVYNKWGHFFGMYLGYDNKDNAFAASQLNGQIIGQLWNTQGDDAQRKYDYTFDNAGRLTTAVFNQQQHPGDGWSNATMDFSVSGVSGQMTYDLNGNLLTMLQKGVVPGTATPVILDDLRYTYNTLSNKLQSVSDQMTLTAVNGLSGDFKDGTNAAGTPDYVYDNNGNVVIDLNKNAQSLNNGAAGTNGISYNYLDKPEQIRIVGKGTIKIVYAADGEKLQRVYIPESGGASTITTYINNFTYQETASLTIASVAPFQGTAGGLSFISFEDGRVRVMTPTSQNNGFDALTENGNITLPNGKMGVWDYFILDYQKNVRMILTEETHAAVNTCTMETSRAGAEDPVFGQTGAGNEVEATRIGTPSGWQSVNTSASVSQLGNLIGHTIGPNTLQKVMAGDSVTATVQYYYASAATSSNPNIIPNILNSLASALGGNATAGTLVHGNGSAITGQLGGTPGFVNAVEPSNATSGPPQAYLTILFFDERFNFISAADGGVAQQQVASAWTTSTAPLGLVNIKAPKNGYAFVYVSNRSDQTVYFDNLAVGIHTGNIIEENHYYAYGLRIAGISSRKLGDAGEGTLKNNYLYNEKEIFDDADLDWDDFGFRNYDPQIGRFVEMDPLTDRFAPVSPYQYGLNDPISNIDKDGLIGIPCPGTSALSIFLDVVGEAVTNGLSAISPALQFISIGINVTNTAMHVETVIQNSNLIDGQLTTMGAGSYVRGPSSGNDDDGDNGGDPIRIPKVVVYPVFEQLTPETYKHIKDVTSGKDGKPLTLHYDDNRARKDARRRRNTRALDSYSDPWRDEYPFASTHEGDFASVRYVPKWEQEIQREELKVITRGLQDRDIIQVILIPKMSPPPIVAPQTDRTTVKKWRTDPVWQPQPINLQPILLTGAGIATGLTITSLLEEYGVYLLFLAL